MILNGYELKEKWLSFCYESNMSSTGVFLRLSILSYYKFKQSEAKPLDWCLIYLDRLQLYVMRSILFDIIFQLSEIILLLRSICVDLDPHRRLHFCFLISAHYLLLNIIQAFCKQSIVTMAVLFQICFRKRLT